MSEFKGLTADHFATYTPDKWSSNVHNLPRMRAKDTMLALCSNIEAQLTEELSGLVRAASDEVPNIVNQKKVDAQWVYWFRDQAARESLASFLEKTPLDQRKLFNIAPQDKHVILAVVLNADELWVGLRLAAGAAVDRRNLTAILEKTWEREQFLELIKELPEGATFGPAGAELQAEEVSLQVLAEQAQHLGDDDPAWLLRHRMSPEDAIELGTDLADHLSRWLGALVPHYRFVAWSKANDRIEVNKQLQEEKAQKRRQALGFEKGDKVRITSGIFSGKIGVVQNIDTKAQVRVQVGKMSVVVSGSDLTSAH